MIKSVSPKLNLRNKNVKLYDFVIVFMFECPDLMDFV